MSAGLSFAFQPIVDTETRSVFSYEALLRGVRGEGPGELLGGLAAEDVARLDQRAWPVALDLARRLGLSARLNLNATPEGIAGGRLPRVLLDQTGFALTDVVVEITEDRLVSGPAEFTAALETMRAAGVRLAIDDFGAGHSGLNLLADFQPDLLKLDRHLVRDIGSHGPRQAIVRAVLQVCEDLGIDVIAEGIETPAEAAWFRHAGVRYCQGFLFGRPGFETLCDPCFPPP